MTSYSHLFENLEPRLLLSAWTGENGFDANTLALYHFNETSGTTAVNAQGNTSRNLTLGSSSMITNGTDFLGRSSYFINASFGTATSTAGAIPTDYTKGLTISFWYKCADQSSTSDRTPVSLSNSGYMNLNAFVYHPAWNNPYRPLMANIQTMYGTSSDINTRLLDGNWHNVAITHNTSNTAKLYIDNVLLTSWTDSGGSNLASTAQLVVGTGLSGINAYVDELLIEQSEITDFSKPFNANHAPVATGESYVVTKNDVLVVSTPGVLSNDTDQDSDPLTAIQVTGPSHGTLTLNSNGSFTYTPSSNYTGADSFTYKANDGKADSNTVTVSLTVNAPSGFAWTAENTSDSNTLALYHFNETSGTTAVNAQGNTSRNLTLGSSSMITNSTDFLGRNSYFINTSFGTAVSSTSAIPTDYTKGLTIDFWMKTSSQADANFTPVSVDQQGYMNENAFFYHPGWSNPYRPLMGNVGTMYGTAADLNSRVLNGAWHNIAITHRPSDHTARLYVDNVLITSWSDSGGTNLFSTAELVVGSGFSGVTCYIDELLVEQTELTDFSNALGSANHAPVASNDSYTATQNQALVISSPGVLTNDTDQDLNALTAVQVTGPSHGTLTLNSNGGFTYTPSTGYSGADSFTYKANDGQADSNTATVSLTVNATGGFAWTAENTADSNTLALYHFNESSGTTSSDASGNGRNLTLGSSSMITNGTDFLGRSSYFLNMNFGQATSAAQAIPTTWSSDMTISFWMKTSVQTDGTYTPVLISNGLGWANEAGFTYHPQWSQPYRPKMANISTQYGDLNDINSRLLNGAWHNVAITHQASTNTARLYVDNVLMTSWNDAGGSNLASGAEVYVGQGYSGLNAYVDELLIQKQQVTDFSNALNANTSSLPTPWVGGDIGSCGVAGSSSYASSTFTVGGSGADIYGTADAFRYVYQPLTGDGTIIARVASITNTDGWAKAGVMIRESLAAGASEASVLLSPTNGTAWEYRTSTGGSTTAVTSTGSAPYWVKLVRTGNSFAAYTSSNGSSWTQMGSTQTITMASSVYIGLAVTSHNNTLLNTSTFDNVSVTGLGGANNPPTAVNDSYSTNEDTQLVVSSPGVLSNDSDLDNNPITAIKVTNPSHGTLTFNSNGSFTYVPSANYYGSDSFTYKANDGTADSNVATVSLTINAVNDAPVAVNDSYSTTQNTSLIVSAPGVMANDYDVENSALTPTKLTNPSHGTLTFNGNGGFTYVPSNGYTGSDSFTYKVNDGSLDSNTATVSLTVNASGPWSDWVGVPVPPSSTPPLQWDQYMDPYINTAQTWVNQIDSWYSAGTASGLTQDKYRSYDGDHSELRPVSLYYPQLTEVGAEANNWDSVNAQNDVFGPRITFANQSFGSFNNPLLDGSPANMQEAYNRQTAHDWYTNGYVDAMGEKYFANFYQNNCLLIQPSVDTYSEYTFVDKASFLSPNYIMTIGHSGSDCYLMKPILMASAALPPAVKTTALRNGVYVPLLMNLFKSKMLTGNIRDAGSNTSAYTLPAEATANNGATPKLDAMINYAHNLTHVPPVARMGVESVTMSGTSYARGAYYDQSMPESFIGCVRSGETMTIVVNLNPTWKDAGQSITSTYAAVLRGPGSVTSLGGGRYQISVPWTNLGNTDHDNRTDIILVANDGTYDSAPAYISIHHIQDVEKSYFGV